VSDLGKYYEPEVTLNRLFPFKISLLFHITQHKMSAEKHATVRKLDSRFPDPQFCRIIQDYPLGLLHSVTLSSPIISAV
jgi:hypothetical protein